MWETAEIHRHMEGLIMENSDDCLVPLPEVPSFKRVGRQPSLRALLARKAAREAAYQPTKASSSEMSTTDYVGRHKFSWQCPRRGTEEVSLSSRSARIKRQEQIPSSVAIAGAASLGLRRRNRHTSEPPQRTTKVASKGAFICPERVCLCVPATGFTPKAPAVPRTYPGKRRFVNGHVLYLADTREPVAH